MKSHRSEPMLGRRWRLGAVVASALFLLGAATSARADELPTVKIAVGGGLILFFAGSDAVAATAPDPRRGNMLALASGVTYALMLAGLRWQANQRGAPFPRQPPQAPPAPLQEDTNGRPRGMPTQS